MDDQDRVAALIEKLRDRIVDVRIFAAVGLGRLGPQAAGAVDALIEALKDRDSDVRWETATERCIKP